MERASATVNRPPASASSGRLTAWLRRTHGPVNGVIRLDRRHLYILPTRGGIGFAVLLMAMLMTSLNYNISLGFALTFLLAGIGMACMWMAYRNMLDLAVSAGPAAPAFAGAHAVFALHVDNAEADARIGVEARTPLSDPAAPSSLTLDGHASGELPLRLRAERRGRLALPRVTLASRFPFGLFRVWSYADLPLSTFVYPAPESDAPPLPLTPRPDDADDGALVVASDDGIDQLRRYRTGDPLHRIAWKHSARTGRWLSRTGQTPRQPGCWLEWDAIPPAFETEARLSRLCAWVLAASDDMDIGLRLPGVEIPPGHGAAHRRACLEALSLWPERRAS
ncbi:Uncharacterized conserved protein, DUF58 family, contains vWF domain [Cupriavidus sp. YR651]|uniref:DUF58 domain-containing protein n=1 Tax=Cupriavidus sp. YR651 TaxID=1855315 RepID=UPI00088898B5|nr:DUF58 domain-containing protein [Cupriavidus sp. YR651]SDD60681.1 Uncharacterized conserved protein, DUF58 family, contains vWF domain [Cupriavidus sp. YR651]